MDIQDFGKEAIDKGTEVISNLADKAGDLSIKAKIKMQLIDQGLELDSLMKKLGEAVYEEVRLDERYTNAYPELFEQIEEVKARKQALENEYARVEEESRRKNGEQSEKDTE